MKKGLLVLISVLFSIQLQAQNWACFNPDSVSYYWDGESALRAIVIEQVNASTGAVSNFKVAFKDTSCNNASYYPYDGYRMDEFSWLGQDVLIDNNGQFLFRNKAGEKILFKTTDTVGYSWAFYISGNDTIWAEFISITKEPVLGVLDSVKRIQLRTNSPDSLLQQWHFDTLRLSKGNGLLDFPFIRDFPKKNTCTKTNENPLKNYDVYNYRIGDKFQFKLYENSYSGVFNSYELYHVVDVVRRGDTSVTYTFGKEIISLNNSSVSYESITRQYDNLQYWLFNGIPYRIYATNPSSISSGFSYSHVYVRYPNSNRLRLASSKWSDFRELNTDGCWYVNYIDEGGCNNLYIAGVGLVYNCSGIGGDFRKNLIYYESGSEIIGSRYTYVGIEDILQTDLDIYPNPANTQLNIELNTNAPASITLVNILGEVVYKNQEKTKLVDVSSFTNGLYFLQIEVGEKKLTRKILIQH